MKRFDYLTPGNLSEALDLLAQRPEAAPLAGGTNVLVQIKEGHRSETALLSLKRLAELRHITLGDKPPHNLVIGAATTMKRLAEDSWIRQHYSALAAAAGLVGSVQTRNMATVGGNLCNASPSADTAPPLLVFDAWLTLVSAKGERSVPLAEFFTGPGATVLKTGELLKEIVVAPLPENTGSAYVRHIPRGAMDISVVGVAAAVSLDPDRTIARARIALGAVAPTPIRAYDAERLLGGRAPSEDLLATAGDIAAAAAQPIEDVRASVAYRRHLVKVLTEQALRQAIEGAQK